MSSLATKDMPSLPNITLPKTPPTTPIPIGTHEESRHNYHHSQNVQSYSAEYSMVSNGYIPIKAIAVTLQGSIWKALTINNEKCIIKVTLISLYNESSALVHGKRIPVLENIIKEASILNYLTINSPPPGICRFISFFMDDVNYFLVEEDAGNSLFDFVVDCHKCIINKKLEIKEWQRFCKLAMKQMVDTIEWMHNKMHTTHLDISLENFAISEVFVSVNGNKEMSFLDNFKIKLIDFGLGEVFENINKDDVTTFKCNKYCGKRMYEAPEVYAKKDVFDARAADVWSLGCLLFCMITGAALFKKPSSNDPMFRYVISGHLVDVLTAYNKSYYISYPIFDLMFKMLKYEKYRINITDVKKHKWFQ